MQFAPRATHRFAGGSGTLPSNPPRPNCATFHRTQRAPPLRPETACAPPFRGPTLASRSTPKSRSPPRPRGKPFQRASTSLGVALRFAKSFEKLGNQISGHRRAISRRGSNVVDRPDLGRRRLSRQQHERRIERAFRFSSRSVSARRTGIGATLPRAIRTSCDRSILHSCPAPRCTPWKWPARCAFPLCARRKNTRQIASAGTPRGSARPPPASSSCSPCENSRYGTRRSPRTETSISSASYASSAGKESAAGDALTILPPSVPRF